MLVSAAYILVMLRWRDRMVSHLSRVLVLFVFRFLVVYNRLSEGLATHFHSFTHLLIINQSLVTLVLTVVISLRIPMGVPLGWAINRGWRNGAETATLSLPQTLPFLLLVSHYCIICNGFSGSSILFIFLVSGDVGVAMLWDWAFGFNIYISENVGVNWSWHWFSWRHLCFIEILLCLGDRGGWCRFHIFWGKYAGRSLTLWRML